MLETTLDRLSTKQSEPSAGACARTRICSPGTIAIERWLDLSGADLESRAEEVCADVGLAPALLAFDVTRLSGVVAVALGGNLALLACGRRSA